MSDTLLLVLFGLCIVASAFFSTSETALTSLSETTLHRFRERRHPQSQRLDALCGDLPRTIGAILIGNTLVNIAAGSIGTAVAIGVLGERWGVVAATIGATVLLLVLGEATPKTLAARRPETVAPAVAQPVALLVRWTSPFTALLGGTASFLLGPLGRVESGAGDVTEEDVRSLISLSHQHGALEAEETEILHNVLDFGDTPVRSAMVPRAQMVSLPASSTFEAVRAAARGSQYSRIPVHRESPDDIIGILHLKDLFEVTDAQEKAFDLSKHLRPAVFVPEVKRAGDLFREMRRRRFHMAIVVDELGAVAGLVTLEDLVEEILGDIADEHDEPAATPVLDGASVLVEGSHGLSDLESELGLALPSGGAETVAGYLLKAFGRIPRTGARTRFGEYELVVERASPRAIEKVRITRKPRTPAADGGHGS